MYDIGTVRQPVFETADGHAPVRDAAAAAAGALYPVADRREARGMDGVETGAAAVAADAYREAMSRLASAVHIVTTDGPGGRAGFTASAVCSVSDAPPTLLVCINRSSSAYAAVSRNDALCVSTLGAEHHDLAKDFGGRVKPAERFALADWTRLQTGAPALAGALVAFDCRIVGRHPAGTHDVLFCEVQALAAPEGDAALVYAGRGYHALPQARRETELAAPRLVPPAAA